MGSNPGSITCFYLRKRILAWCYHSVFMFRGDTAGRSQGDQIQIRVGRGFYPQGPWLRAAFGTLPVRRRFRTAVAATVLTRRSPHHDFRYRRRHGRVRSDVWRGASLLCCICAKHVLCLVCRHQNYITYIGLQFTPKIPYRAFRASTARAWT